MALRDVKGLSHSRCNGTHSRHSGEKAKTKKTEGKANEKAAGAAVAADSTLKAAIRKAEMNRGQYFSDLAEPSGCRWFRSTTKTSAIPRGDEQQRQRIR